MVSQNSSELISTQEFSTQGSLADLLLSGVIDESDIWAKLIVRYRKKKTLGMKSPLYFSPNTFEIDLIKNKFSAGRSPSNDFCFTNINTSMKSLQKISNVHFKICKEMEENQMLVTIKDYSTNGSFVNGERVGLENERLLKMGDVISVLTNDEGLTFTFKPLYLIQNDLPANVNEHFQVGRKLGAGSYGEVFLVRHYITCEKFAMKVVQKKLDENSTTLNEANLLKDLSHPAIIKMYHIETFENDTIIWLEYMAGGSLSDRIYRTNLFTENVMKFLFYQIFHGVKYLHDNNITHRDLKPDNILLSSYDDYPQVKISDLGLSKLTQDNTSLRTFVGTIAYLAPEVLRNNGKESYTKKIDTWSLGVILFVCLTGDFPYDEDCVDNDNIFQECYTGNCLNISECGKNIINKMLTYAVDKRPTVNHLLVDVWFNDNVILLARKTFSFQQNKNKFDAQSAVDFKYIFK